MADAKAAQDVTQSYTTLQGGDLFGVERSGVFGKFTWSNFQAQSMTLTGTIDMTGATVTPYAGSFTTLSASGVVDVASDIQHTGDTDNKIAFGTDTQSYETGGSSRLDISDSGVRLGGTGARVTDIETTITDDDAKLPTSGAVVDLVAATFVSGTAGPVATTSGTTVNLSTSIPAGVTRISIMFNGVSLNGTDGMLVQLSTGASFLTSGYSSSSDGATSSSGLVIAMAAAVIVVDGVAHLEKDPSSDEWYFSHSLGTGTNSPRSGGGVVDLGGTLDGIRLTATGSNNFDAGNASLRWRS